MDDWGQPGGQRFLQLDLRQLHTLLILLETCSITGTAVRLGHSQPAVSQTLRRLRDLIGDPLLVRSGARMVPTVRAARMIAPLRKALAGFDNAIRPEDRFDPSAGEHVFRIAAADCMEAYFVPRLIGRIRNAAPQSRIILRSVVAGYDYAAALENDELDVVIANWPSPPGNLRTVRLLSDDMACIFAADHPLNLTRRLTLDAYLALDHVAPTPLSTVVPGPVDGRLTDLGLTRNIKVIVPEFNLVPYALMSSDLVFTSSRQFARHYEAFLPIRSMPAPPEFGQMRFYLLWHERAQTSAANHWLRGQIVEIARSLGCENDEKDNIASS